MCKYDVSVIIPVYNGEKYIGRCLESILNQSYKDIRIFIVNDASTDKSADIIQRYAIKDNRIYYTENFQKHGAAKSRNLGLKSVDSDYVLFLDCDDWLDINCIEKAVEKFKADSEIDIVTWEVKTAYAYNKISSRYKYTYNNIITNSMALSLLSHSFENEFFLSPLLGCKLFKKSVLEYGDITFPDTLYEDDMFTFLAFLHSKKIGLITGSYLYYYQHPESLTHHFTQKNIDDFFKTFKLLGQKIKDEEKEYYYKYLKKCLSGMINSMLINVSDPEAQNQYKAIIFTQFYHNIDVMEFYSYSSTLTI